MYSTYTAIECISADARLVRPALEKVAHQEKWITLISPPKDYPDVHLLLDAGVHPNSVRMIHYDQEELCALACQAAENGLSSLVMLWVNTPLKQHEMQALQRASQLGNCMSLVFRKAQTTQHYQYPLWEDRTRPSPASLA